MADNKTKDVTIGISAEYDSSGADQAKREIEELDNAAASPVQGGSTEASAEVQQLTAAREEAAAAAAAEKEQEEALRLLMELESKTLKQLEEEVLRLSKARKEASAAGDTESYKRLTEQLTRTKSAMGEMKQAAALNKAALMGQASAGLQFAGTLGGLAQQVKSGTMDIAGMATGVMSLGMALKAGLGPIGWAMAAVQMLSAAVEYLATAEDKAAEAAAEHARAVIAASDAMVAAEKRHTAAVIETYEQESRLMAEQRKMRLRQKQQEQQLEARGAAQQRAHAAQEMQDNSALLDARHREEVALGKKTRAEVETERKKQQDDERNQQAEHNEKDLEERLEARKIEKEKALGDLRDIESLKSDLAGQFGKAWEAADNPALREYMEQVVLAREAIESARAEKEKLTKQLEEDALPDDMREDLKARIKWAAKDVKEGEAELRGAMSALAESIGGDALHPEETVAEYEEVYRKRKELDEKHNQAQEALTQATYNVAEAENELAAARERRARQARLAEAEDRARRAEQQRAEREEKWGQMQELTMQAQAQYAREVLASMAEGSEEAKKWAQRLKAAERGVRADGWAEVQRRGLEEQQSYVQRMLAATQAGTQEHERWAREAERLQTRGVSEELDRMAETLKTSRNWAEQDARTEAQQLVEDGKALRAKQERLQALLATPGLDAETQKRVNKLLRETQRGLANYRTAMQQAGAEAARSLENAKMPDMRAANRGAQRSVDAARKRYEAALRRAADAAAKGDDKALARWQDAMKVQARKLESRTGWGGQAVAAMKQHMDSLTTLMASGNRAQKAELVKRQAILRATETAAEEAKRKAEAEKKNREAAEKEVEKRATLPTATTATPPPPTAQPATGSTLPPQQPAPPPPTPAPPPQEAGAATQADDKLQALSAQLESARAALVAMESGLGKMLPALAGLVSAAERGARVVEPLPDRVAQLQGALASKYRELERRIEKIRTDI